METISFLTTEDLQQFKSELFAEIKQLINGENTRPVRWMRSKQTLKVLNVSYSTLQSYRTKGLLNPRKIEGILYFDIQEIEKLLEGSPNV